MFYNSNNEYARMMMEEERRLLKEVSNQRMSWKKLGNVMKLQAMMRANERG